MLSKYDVGLEDAHGNPISPSHPMSIDHGKLLEKLTLVAQAIKPIKGLQGMDETINEAIRALAQPAEAVEGDETDPTALQIEYARGYGDGVKHGEQLRPTAAVSPEELRLYVSEQEACELERSHDAAQGAVAPFGWLHEIKWTDGWGSPKYVHGPDKPKPHIEQCDADMRHLVEPLVDGERFTPLYAHPQAAPAQGASLRHANPHLTKESVERNVRSSSALEGISTKTFQAASAGDEE